MSRTYLPLNTPNSFTYLTNLSYAVVNALDFGSGVWWFESKPSQEKFI
jgi:hypothetical protein